MIDRENGFTLIELLVAIAIISVLAAVGIPVYKGYINGSRAATAQNSLRAIYLAEKEYYSENGAYYGTPTGNQTVLLNTNLFAGNQTLDGSYYFYFVTLNGTTAYTATAQKISDGTTYTITNLNVRNFN